MARESYARRLAPTVCPCCLPAAPGRVLKADLLVAGAWLGMGSVHIQSKALLQLLQLNLDGVFPLETPQNPETKRSVILYTAVSNEK